MILTATVPTTHGSRYLQQLCKHWSHKFDVDFDADKGEIGFPMGPIRMAADHLDRFAFREAPLSFDWR